jgi:predicted GH43/DUF377 family glycosyl hydrolase
MMFKSKVVVLVLLIAVLACGEAYSQQERTISGKIVKVDVEGSVIGVETYKGMVVFYLSAETNLYRSTHHMSVIEIEKDDPVTIQYITTSGRNNAISVVDGKA